MDRLSHPFSSARSSTHRTARLYRRSRPRTIRPPRRLPRRVLWRHETDHHPSPLRRHLRASRTHATLLPGGKSSNGSPNRWSARRPRPARVPRLARRSHLCHRLTLSGETGLAPSQQHDRNEGARRLAVFETWAAGQPANFPTRHPYHFRATRYCVSLLTGTIYGSTLSIPEHFCRSPLKEATTINTRGETQS